MQDQQRESILRRLVGYRLEHTLGCEQAARALALRFGADPEAAGLAAILHDITKHYAPAEQFACCEKYGIVPCPTERAEPKLLHGKTAAAIAREEYGISDEIYNAIACHTTGKANMTLLEKILYMADYIEPTRDFDGVQTARRLAEQDLDRALLYCFSQTLVDLAERGRLIHSDTVGAFNALVAAGVPVVSA